MGGGGDFKMQDFFLYSKVEILFFFTRWLDCFFLVGELSYVSYVTFINTSIKINRLESR